MTVPARGAARPPERTDLGNARRLVGRFGSDLRYVAEWGRWIAWDGRRWAHDVTGEVVRAAKAVADMMVEAARVRLRAATTDAEAEAARAALRFGLQAQAAPRLRAMVELAATEAGMPVLVDQLDADPWLLVVGNGTLDLRTGALRASNRGDLLTRATDVVWDPDATCPRFRAFLERILPDDDIRAFVQRAAGYSLTALAVENVLLVCLGRGANGKSTLMERLLRLFGGYGSSAPPRLLVVEKHLQHPTAIADLHGRRLVVSQEVDEGHRLDEALVKQLTGGDRLTARRMREDFWTFTPTHTLWLACNHKPVIRGTDEGVWRRIRLIPFAVTIPEEERDPHLGEKLDAELPGILRWAVEGCLAWQREGLAAPKAVTLATSDYRRESDIVGQWIEERCATGPGHRARSTELYGDYLAWCSANGIPSPLSLKALAGKLGDRGFDRSENHRGQAQWTGLALCGGSEEGDP